jgi:hypothetical protein
VSPGPDDWARLSQQSELSEDDVADISRRLDRMDERSPTGAWTRRTLELIADHPAVVSTELAKQIGMERFAFKANVRKLKRLGLTHSLEVGYQLSPRGRAYKSSAT